MFWMTPPYQPHSVNLCPIPPRHLCRVCSSSFPASIRRFVQSMGTDDTKFRSLLLAYVLASVAPHLPRNVKVHLGLTVLHERTNQQDPLFLVHSLLAASCLLTLTSLLTRPKCSSLCLRRNHVIVNRTNATNNGYWTRGAATQDINPSRSTNINNIWKMSINNNMPLWWWWRSQWQWKMRLGCPIPGA